MAQNRKIPYGYKKELGKIVVDSKEKEVIRKIYIEYANGLSYNEIAKQLTKANIKYLEEKSSWNKNIVDRILKNTKYLGEDDYPAIIDVQLKKNAELGRKTYKKTITNEIKMIKPLLVCGICKSKVERAYKQRGVERWRCTEDATHISVDLTDIELEKEILKLTTAEIIQYKFKERIQNMTSIEVVELQNTINKQLCEGEIDVEIVQNNIKKLAELKYLMLDTTTHMFNKSIKLLTENPKMYLDELKTIVESIEIEGVKAKRVTLINGVTLEGGVVNEKERS